MRGTILRPKQSINKAWLKVKPERAEIELFKANLSELLDRINDGESEEFHKNLVRDFLKKTYYDPDHFINTKGRNDLVIHNGQDAETSVGLILEAKKPTNKSEMVSTEKLNTKAFQELVLYYLRERITHKNLEVKHLVITNIYEWFIFEARFFDRIFAQNRPLVKQFEDFEDGRLADTRTDFFYKQIAEPLISNIETEIEFTYFNLRDYLEPLKNTSKADDNKLIVLFKLLSPEHLLKLPFANDSNSLDKRFYSELLHIIGLTETKEGGKKLIERKKEGGRNTGSLLEDAIIQLDSLDKIGRLDQPNRFGSTHEERLFNVALELSITWINRILFLKLLEAQLITYHQGDKSYAFLNLGKIKDYDGLNSLFFQVLARKYEERNQDVKKLFEKVPYLNSSLFEPTDIEHNTLFISNLKDDKTLPVFPRSVLKDQQGRRLSGNLTTLDYLFRFLDAFDFSSEGSEEIQEENKTLINASVLGLIFEKINGYKDGSFFTPGFITMYMCRETIRKAVIQKFNETKNWNCSTIEELYNKIEDSNEANNIVNSIKICDPAVGSGHFLVSTLNEIIAIKNDLKILQDRTGKRLKEYLVQVENDELIVTDEDGELFEYNPTSPERQRIQETLFHEKQTIIENCLFGVDINPNSVKICRLRLWIELLKNAYYKNSYELETLPNIDINIKCGNSLVSRFGLDADLSQALKKSRWTIDDYRIAVDTYRNAEDKEQKREMERLIADIKSDFRSEISKNDPKMVRLRKLQGELIKLTTQHSMFELGKKEKAAWNKKLEKHTLEIKKLETEIEEIKANRIFENAFEWRFEFPEVLDDNGDFVGFDVVIANPPYYQLSQNNIEKSHKEYLVNRYGSSMGRLNTYGFFIVLGIELEKNSGQLSFIIPNTLLMQDYYEYLRHFILNNGAINTIVLFDNLPFDEAIVENVILDFTKKAVNDSHNVEVIKVNNHGIFNSINKITQVNYKSTPNNSFNTSLSNISSSLMNKISRNAKTLSTYTDINQAIALKGDRAKWVRYENIKPEYKPLLVGGKNIDRYAIKWDGAYLEYNLDGIHSCKREDIFNSNEKILFRRVANKIIAALDDSKYYGLHTLVVINNKKDSPWKLTFILGLLNSSLLNWYYKEKYFSTKTIFSEIGAKQIRELPIKFSGLKQTEISQTVSQILSLKKQNIQADTTALEAKIDQLVYKLYGLTEEEIKIIENE